MCLVLFVFCHFAAVCQRGEYRCAQCAEDDGEGDGDGDVYPVEEEHFAADEAQYEGEAVVEEDEAVGHVGEQEYMARSRGWRRCWR